MSTSQKGKTEKIKKVFPQCPHCKEKLFQPNFGSKAKKSTFNVQFKEFVTTVSGLAQMIFRGRLITEHELQCPHCGKQLRKIICLSNKATFQIVKPELRHSC